ncbi:MAG: hypothetical protein ACLTXM_06045 [Enterococcus sp.]|uniref:hypothetical protein n=1 Tax=Enterococcus raffinosus TaxID=71452 RepID=UPI001C0FB237|nr:hypothetical protein [Enterococcus raffinosus]MBU5360558.1 hypothetical protein [Enterococcus raffinosus]
MEMNELEYDILNEIAKKNFNNLTHQFFEASETDFEESIEGLKESGFIQGSIFKGNGTLRNPFRFFFLSAEGEAVLDKCAS